jgi:hypothetical protein
LTFVALLVSVIAAFGILAPLESRTVPTIDPVSIWPNAAAASTIDKAKPLYRVIEQLLPTSRWLAKIVERILTLFRTGPMRAQFWR